MIASIPYTGSPDFVSLEAAAIQASIDHPRTYVLVVAFGFDSYRLHLHRSLPRDARSRVSNSGPLRGCYFLSGKRRSFTFRQIVADQQDWR